MLKYKNKSFLEKKDYPFLVFEAQKKKHYLFRKNFEIGVGGRRGGVPTWPPKAAEKNDHW